MTNQWSVEELNDESTTVERVRLQHVFADCFDGKLVAVRNNERRSERLLESFVDPWDFTQCTATCPGVESLGVPPFALVEWRCEPDLHERRG